MRAVYIGFVEEVRDGDVWKPLDAGTWSTALGDPIPFDEAPFASGPAIGIPQGGGTLQTWVRGTPCLISRRQS